MEATKYRVVLEKTIDHCYHECLHFGLDGGPGAVMYCGHPDLKADSFTDRYIISHPQCQTGVPEKCPLRWLPEAKVEG